MPYLTSLSPCSLFPTLSASFPYCLSWHYSFPSAPLDDDDHSDYEYSEDHD